METFDGEPVRRIGATDIPCLLGIDPYRTAADVYARIVHRVEIEQTPVMRRGLLAEPAIRAIAAEQYGLQLEPRDLLAKFIVCSEAHPFATASPDDYASRDGLQGVAEYKSVTRWSAKKWGVEGSDGVPEHYLCQCHWLMAVTQRSPVWLVAAFGEDVKGEDRQPTGEFDIAWTTQYLIQRDPELEAYLLSVGERFWSQHILKQVAPAAEWWQSSAMEAAHG
jgi:putative phage-type endonuclease